LLNNAGSSALRLAEQLVVRDAGPFSAVLLKEHKQVSAMLKTHEAP